MPVSQQTAISEPDGADSERARDEPGLPHFYREILAEREEILRNKWYLSECAGRDVGFDVALIDWVTHHRQQWIEERDRRLHPIEKAAQRN